MLLTVREILRSGLATAVPASEPLAGNKSVVVSPGNNFLEIGLTYSFTPANYFSRGNFVRGVLNDPVSLEEYAYRFRQSRPSS